MDSSVFQINSRPTNRYPIRINGMLMAALTMPMGAWVR